ncbi:nickel pincer cofactor biosynthesis protein LarC [Tuberibacillus sp. Marseille-P3662]|uniref:nickel pincer cofactor biosynthesis protein LarC n=1 Tax=Tuberibacillus sp. Marseille-P3662 TaxID=1965358 RepID=UPI000A1CEBE1|nr:nickel pincer cofactor biosynthesis protein LarC [Tuberibacillus sp. Marseille-P3662]
MKTLYFDCFSGISGDMTIGALIDAGADPYKMADELKKLAIQDEYELSWQTVNKNGITSTTFDVILSESHDSHHHGHHHHRHHHRHYSDIVDMIHHADFDETSQQLALAMFKVIGEAEGKIHGIPLENVHFHEVGSIDSIIDIVGTALLISQIQPDYIMSSSIPPGYGSVHIDHGIYPVPAPATLEILKGIPLQSKDVCAELTTPTGAAMISVLVDQYGPFPSITTDHIGYGAGTKTFDTHPNVLRIVIGH